MKITLFKKALLLLLAVLMILPTLLACGRKITLDDAKYTMGKFFSAIGEGDYAEAVTLMHPSSNVTAAKIESFLSEVEDKTGGSFDDGISNVRYTSYEELPHNTAPGGSKFRVYGTFNIGAASGISFAISLVMDSNGYGMSVIDIDGVAL